MVDIDVIEDGDSVNNKPEPYTDENLPKSLKAVNTKSVFRRMGLEKKKLEWNKAYQSAKPVARNIVKKEVPIPKQDVQIHDGFSNEQVERFQNTHLGFVHRLEKQFEDRLQSYLDRLNKIAVGNVRELLPTKAVGDKQLFDMEDEIDNVVAVSYTHLDVYKRQAKHPDSTVVTILRWNKELGKKELINWLELRGENYKNQFDIIIDFLGRYKICLLYTSRCV